MPTLARRQKIYLALVILFVVLAAISLLLIWPWWQEISNLRKEINQEKQSISELQQKEMEVKKLTKEEKEIKSDLDKLKKALTLEDDPLNFILAAEKIGEKYDLKQSITLQSEKEETEKKPPKEEEEASEDKLEKLPAIKGQIILEGEFRNLLSYLAYFEKIIPLAEIMDLEIRSGETKQIKSNIKEEATLQTNKLTAVLNIRVFTQ